MQFLTFYLFRLLVYPLSYLPMSVLYRISDMVYVLFYHWPGYRKQIVHGNLQVCFPEKSEAEREAIAAKFYAHLCDLIFEILKSFSISEKELAHQCRVNGEIVEEALNGGTGVVLMLGHYGNWEWAALSASSYIPNRLISIYKRITNPYFERFQKEKRGRFSMGLVEMLKVGRFYAAQKSAVAVAFVADQTPANHTYAYWLEFLGRETAFHAGPAKITVKYKQRPIFVKIEKLSRGRYELKPEFLSDVDEAICPEELTLRYAHALEQQIKERPEFWLWSHRRWKHTRTDKSPLIQRKAAETNNLS